MTRRKNDEPDVGQVPLFEMESEGSLPPTLRKRFLVPPFSVLDARQGYWQARKRAWIRLGIQSELGRGENLIGRSDQTRDINHYSREPRLLEDEVEAEEFSANGGGLTYGDGPQITEKGLNYYRNQAKEAKYQANGHAGSSGALHNRIGEAYGRKDQTGTSIFDPVLCEVACRWFTNAGARILDPFAGGSVRGIVAAKLGRSYIGVDLSPYQVEANRQQAQRICKGDPYRPVWRVGDSNDLDKICEDDDPVDFVFTCPPYYDLEIYSKDPRDISNAGTYDDFANTYSSIIYQACKHLKDNRFAAIVIGDIRDKQGMYRTFFQDTIAAFAHAGLKLYNTAVLVTVTGSLPVRVSKPFVVGRKLGRTHQYVLQFVKGDPKKATLHEL